MEYNEKLARALKEARNAGDDGIVRSKDISSSAREILVKAGFLEKLVRGWYMLITPDAAGSTTAWYSVYWSFLRLYLADRFGDKGYCLSPQSSIDLLTGETRIPGQVVVITQKHSNVPLELPVGTSILMYHDLGAFPPELAGEQGVNIMPLATALARLAPRYYQDKPRNVEIALSLLESPSQVSRELVRLGAVSAAERIAGACIQSGNTEAAEKIVHDMDMAGFRVRPGNPFEQYEPVIKARHFESPLSARVVSYWQTMREQVISCFPDSHGPHEGENTESIVSEIQSFSREDAYHSLSIEGYRITDDLISKIGAGQWDPDAYRDDRSHLDALAARGYQRAFDHIMSAIKDALSGGNTGSIARAGIQSWYQELFHPMVQAGILAPQDLIDYRRAPVYIKGSRHVPPPYTAVRDAMDTFFSLLEQEEHGAVRAILGHYFLAYIHPYMDGNGRLARFLMNFMFISAGYQWTILRATERNAYMSTLESAGTDLDITPFAEFVKREMEYWKMRAGQ